MQPRRVLAIARRLISQIRRDHRSVGLIFVVPMLVMGLLGYILRIESGRLAIGIVAQDQGVVLPTGARIAAAERLVEILGEREPFASAQDAQLAVREITLDEGEQLLRDGSLDALVVLPEGFTQAMAQGGEPQLEIVLEGSNPGQRQAVMFALTGALAQGLQAGPASAALPAVEFETRYIYGGEEFDFLDSFAPVYIAFFAFFFVFLLTGVSFLRERSQGTMERLLATPVGRGEIVLGYMLGFGLFAVVQSAVILLFTIYVLRIHHVGSLALVFLVEALLTVGAVNLGIFFSTYARTELQVVQFIPIVIVPQVLLSGLIVRVENLPLGLQILSSLMPLTYANRAMTDVMVRGLGLSEVTLELVALLGFAVVALLLSALTLRRQFV
ncbi:MAG: ABC transporter permease [Chloroflexota bacterium]